jgi:hypothetical protein
MRAGRGGSQRLELAGLVARVLLTSAVMRPSQWKLRAAVPSRWPGASSRSA